MKHKYNIKSTGYSSDKYGNCEICKKHAPEVYLQTKYKGNSYVSTTFGHKECLVNIQIKS